MNDPIATQKYQQHWKTIRTNTGGKLLAVLTLNGW